MRSSWRAAADGTTRAFFVESIPNPQQDIPDLRALADGHVGQRRVRSDDGVFADDGASVQLRTRQQGGVDVDADVDVDPGGGGVDDGDTGAHEVVQDPSVQLGAEFGQLQTIVAAGDQRGGAEPTPTPAYAERHRRRVSGSW